LLKRIALTFLIFLVVGFVATNGQLWLQRTQPGQPASKQVVEHVRDQRTATRDFEKWLKEEGTPEDRHIFVLGANWDFTDIKLFEWIASQPDCDKATALVLFWKGQGDYYAKFANESEVPPVNVDGYRLARLIRDRWASGKYIHSNIAFEMEKDVWKQNFAEIDSALGPNALGKIPVSMRQDIAGKRLSENCCTEGIPNRFWPNGGGRI
jgi:hypothetical protein